MASLSSWICCDVFESLDKTSRLDAPSEIRSYSLQIRTSVIFIRDSISAMGSDMEMLRFEKSVWSPPIACVIGSSNAAMKASVTSPAAPAGVVGSTRNVGNGGTGVLIAMRAALPCFKTSGVAGDGGARSPPRGVPGIRHFVTARLCECDDAE